MKASRRWASKESPTAVAAPGPGRLPAPLCFGFEAGCHPGELHLVTEEPAPDTAVFVLPPAKVAVGVDPGPAESLVLAAAAGGAHFGGGVEELFVRGPLLHQPKQVAGRVGDSRPTWRSRRRAGSPRAPRRGGPRSGAGPWPPARPPPGAPWPRRSMSPRPGPATPPPIRDHPLCTPRSRAPSGRTGPPPRPPHARPR